MYYVCQLLCDKGQDLPRWQKAFGKRFQGILTIKPEFRDGLWTVMATFDPLPGQEKEEGWPRTLFGVSQLEEDKEARYLSGVELNRSVTAERWLHQRWRLTPLTLQALKAIEDFEETERLKLAERANPKW